MEGGSLFNPGFLGGSFLWWIGQVADDSTWRENIIPGKFQDPKTIPGWGYRYKVRILGLHDQGETVIPSDQLPWAQVMYPVTAGGGQASSYQTPNIRQGNMVFGFFLDGKDQQVPVIMGVLGNNAQTSLAKTIGTNRVTNETPGSLATSGYATGKVPKKGTQKEQVPDESLTTKKPQPPASSTTTPAAGTPTTTTDSPQEPETPEQRRARLRRERTLAIQSGQSVYNRDPNARGGYDPRYDRRPSAPTQSQPDSPNTATAPGAEIETPAAVQQTTVADVKRQAEYEEPIVLLKSDGKIESAIKAIQTTIDKVVKKVNKYTAKLQSYLAAASSLISNIQKIINDAACLIANYMKIIFDTIKEYLLKKLNKELTKIVATIPVDFRFLFVKVKELLFQLIICLYNKVTSNLCSLVQGILNDALGLNDAEEKARQAALDGKGFCDRRTTGRAPMCYAEQVVGKCIAATKGEVDQLNKDVIETINDFLNDIKSKISEASGAISDITNLINGIAAKISDALSFKGLVFNLFGCDLDPSKTVSDKYTFEKGGKGNKPPNLFQAIGEALSEQADADFGGFGDNIRALNPANLNPEPIINEA